MYVIGTSGARWRPGVRSVDDPPGRRPRRRLRRADRRAAAAPARGNPESEALRAKAANHTYNLEHDLALATFRQAVAADPQDAGAYRGLASSLWLSITFRRGNMTVDDYLGRPNKPNNSPLPNPPPDTVTGFRDAIERAIALARKRIAQNPKDADAHYQLGAAVGLRASYTATVEGSVMGAFRAAREAYDEEETVLALQPQRKDAGLIVGTYRYIVAALSLPLRMVAYVAGFGGGKEKGSTRSKRRPRTAATTRPRRASR